MAYLKPACRAPPTPAHAPIRLHAVSGRAAKKIADSNPIWPYLFPYESGGLWKTSPARHRAGLYLVPSAPLGPGFVR